jgi:hypothetical protein
MTDNMPSEIYASREGARYSGFWGILLDWVKPQDKTEYVKKHNNPDYYIVKKSDVQGDVLEALDILDDDTKDHEEHIITGRQIKTIRNALIAQQQEIEYLKNTLDSYMLDWVLNEKTGDWQLKKSEKVIIPRETVADWEKIFIEIANLAWLKKHPKAEKSADKIREEIKEILNYKKDTQND